MNVEDQSRLEYKQDVVLNIAADPQYMTQGSNMYQFFYDNYGEYMTMCCENNIPYNINGFAIYLVVKYPVIASVETDPCTTKSITFRTPEDKIFFILENF